MIKLLFITLISLLSLSSFAQNSKLRIKVLSSENENPVANANIELSEKYFSTTNNYGECDFENIR